MSRGRGSLVGAAVVAAALVLPGSAPAAVTFGNSLVDAPNVAGFNCNNDHYCTVRNVSLGAAQTASGGIVAPFTGVVVRWRIRSGTITAPLTFRVIHPTGGLFTGAGTSASVTPPTNQISPPFPTRLPIAAGDSIGVDCCQSTHDVMRTAAGVGSVNFWGTTTNLALADGESPPRDFDATNGNYELLLNADIEPDADRDGFGDETQDLCPTNASTQGNCPPAATPLTPVKKCKKKRKKKRGAAAAKRCKRKKRKKKP